LAQAIQPVHFIGLKLHLSGTALCVFLGPHTCADHARATE
jgi:hypothetical protein